MNSRAVLRAAFIGAVWMGMALLPSLHAQANARNVAALAPCSPMEISGPLQSAGMQPAVMPRLRLWRAQPGQWTLKPGSRVVVDRASARQVRPIAEQFVAEFLAMTGRSLPIVEGVAPAPHDLAFSLGMCNASVTKTAGQEGYSLFVGDVVSLRANTTAGLRYAKTTLLQMVALRDGPRSEAPALARGYALDAPSFPVRSMMLDVGRLYMRPAFLENFVRFMSWYKFNTLELHLNDQAFGLNKDHTAIDPENPKFFSRSMRLLSPRFPLAAPTDGTPGATTSEGKKGYDRADWERTEAVARDYGVTLKPEIDIPAHSGPFLNARPDLELKGVSPQWGGMFDLSNPGSLQYVNQIFDEFLPWFHSAAISIGGDEAAPERTGVSDQVRAHFLAGVMNHILAKGSVNGQPRTVTMWNDAFAANSALTPLQPSIVIQAWLGKADEYLADRDLHGVVDSRSAWYLVPEKNTDSNEKLAQQIYDEWVLDPRSLGGQICEWNDNAGLGLNESGVMVTTKDVVPAAGQVLWGGRGKDAGNAILSYAEVAAHVQQLGYGPGVSSSSFPALSAPTGR